MLALSRTRLALVGIALGGLASWSATGASGATDHAAAALRDKGFASFQKSNCAEALSLMRQVEKAFPKDAHVFEVIAFCEMAQSRFYATQEERVAARGREEAAAKRAQELGDDSNLLHMVLDELKTPLPEPLANPQMAAAEQAFAKGDLDEALRLYQAIAAAEPKNYEARLFAGDVYFRRHDVKSASHWFDEAIAVNPNRETAHRYYGDLLDGAGNGAAALDRYLDAIIAEPYEKRAWKGLEQWAKRHQVTLQHPTIPLPVAPAHSAKGDNTQITVNAQTSETLGAAHLAYQTAHAGYTDEQFHQDHPQESAYRHSLSEELKAVGVMTVLSHDHHGQTIAELKDLERLTNKKMLEPYLLLTTTDPGIQQDYPAYRQAHRDRLKAYLREFVVAKN